MRLQNPILSAFLLAGLAAFSGCAHRSGQNSAEKAQTFFEIGQSFYTDGRYPDAIEQFTAAHELDDSRSDIPMHLGLAYLKIEDFKKAEDFVKKACQRDPLFAECWNNLSHVYLKAHKPRLALGAAQTALDIPTYPTPEIALSNYGMAALALGLKAEAKRALEKAARLNTKICPPHILLAKAWLLEGEAEEALREAKAATMRCPLVPEAHFWEAFIYFKLGQRRSAQLKYHRILEIFRTGEPAERARLALDRLQRKLPVDEPAT